MNNITIEKIYSLFIQHNQSVCTDSRKPIPGSIFFALSGSNFDGNFFAIEAIEKGCSWAIVDNPEIARKNSKCILVDNVLRSLQALAQHHRKQFNIPIIAITGSNGKTTTKELVSAVLSQKYKVLSTPGNFNNHIGLPLTLLKLKNEHQVAIIEMGANHPGEIKKLCHIAMPDYAIITSIGKEHLEGFGNIENVKKTNGELYEYIIQNQGKIFLHIDNQDLTSILEQLHQSTASILNNPSFILYSDLSRSSIDIMNANKEIIIGQYIESHKDIYVHLKWTSIHSKTLESVEIQKSKEGYALKDTLWKNIPEITTHLLAYHNFINALCAICVGKYFFVNNNDINTAISQYIPDNNRMQFKKTSRNIVILDAYNANPTSMSAALQFFKQKKLTNTFSKEEFAKNFDEGNKILILGDMFELGEHSEKEHLAIIDWIKENFIKGKVYLIGKEFLNALQKTIKPSNIYAFSSTEEFLDALSKNTISEKFILIKASRGMQLERVMEYL